MSEIYDFTVCEIIIFYITIFCICQIFVISYFLIIANYFNKIEFDAKNMYKVETFFTEIRFPSETREKIQLWEMFSPLNWLSLYTLPRHLDNARF